ncbi:hypothetical protein HYV64_04480 [Candidatus Shapirobacteria bacterium]|nr:hypothetical protein [Candidatus Shapirobacteria bacterium]
MKKIRPINITPLTEKYGPGYIAKDKKSGKIIAHASRVDTLMKKVKTTKEQKEVVISWIPKHGARYVFTLSLRIRTGR